MGACASSRSNAFPFGHQILEFFALAIEHVLSFGAKVFSWLTHPEPSFVPFGALAGNAQTEGLVRTSVQARSSRRICAFHLSEKRHPI